MARPILPTQIRRTLGDTDTYARPLYASVGATDLAVEKLRELAGRVADLGAQPAAREEVYGDLARRGRTLVTRIRRQPATRELEEQAQNTVSRSKGAATTARRSAGRTRRTAGESAARTRSATRGAATSARKTAKAAAQAVEDGAAKVGD